MHRSRHLVAVLALLALIGAGGTPASALRRGTTTATISATASPTLLVVNSSSSVAGKVTPATATPTVYLQRKVDGVWLDRGSARVDRTTGAYRIAMRPSQTGAYSLRVRSAGGGVVSRTISVRVWASMRTLSGPGTLDTARIPFAGGTYRVVAAYTGACRYLAVLTGIPGDLATSRTLPSGSGPRTYKMDVAIARRDYTLEVEADSTTRCPWSITFYRA